MNAAQASNWSSRRLHFIGIGGAGMSGLALVCRQMGAEVTGSDHADSSYMERLRATGLEPAVGHDPANLPEGAEVVVSTAIGDDNPELMLAKERGAAPIHRGKLLAELCEEKRLIAVAGTHGKTTTTAMVAWALFELGAEPAFFVGGEVPGLGPGGEVANAGWGEGEWAVAEADESDGSFLDLEPEIAIVTNVEMDHHARWGSLEELTGAFGKFASSAKRVAVPDALEFPLGAQAMARSAEEVLYGEHSRAGTMPRFSPERPGPGELRLAVPGFHNLVNARAALAALDLAGFDLDAAAGALADFPGVHRRLELKGTWKEARIYDDYAHHPTEVRAALEALRAERDCAYLIAVFQPHLYSRTREFAEEFGAALALADEVHVLDVYPAREEPVGDLAGVSGKLVFDATLKQMDPERVHWAPTIEQAHATVSSRPSITGDAVVTIGAGDVFRLADRLVGEGGAA